MISKSLSTSEKFAALVTVAGDLAEFCQALYPLIVSHSDDFGRLQGDTFTVKHMCFPASPRTLDEFSTGLQRLHDVHLVVWYLVAGKRYLQIEQFEAHQQGLHKRTRSNFPRVPGTSGNDQEIPPGKFPEVPDQEKGTEGKRTKGKNPPTPFQGARLTKRELRAAAEIRTRSWGGCQHEPRCVSADECIAAIALSRRESKAS